MSLAWIVFLTRVHVAATPMDLDSEVVGGIKLADNRRSPRKAILTLVTFVGLPSNVFPWRRSRRVKHGVTERRQAVNGRREYRVPFRSLVRNVSNIITVLEAYGRVRQVNPDQVAPLQKLGCNLTWGNSFFEPLTGEAPSRFEAGDDQPGGQEAE